jgi:cell division protein FtsI/penicillin-binding protein 2
MDDKKKYKNIILVVIIILVILLLKNISNNNENNSKLNLKNEENIKKIETVPPQFVFNALNDSNEKILLVNTLSDKEGMKYKITLGGNNDTNSLSKQQFEDLLLKNNNKIPDNIEKVVIYCASWSCNGAKNYYKELIERKINVDKVVDYIGSIHEWASYSKIKPSIFTFNSLENNDPLILSQVNEIFKETAHVYFIDNVLKDDYLKTNSVEGKELFESIF